MYFVDVITVTWGLKMAILFGAKQPSTWLKPGSKRLPHHVGFGKFRFSCG
jgi:hypothetical protein